MNAAPMDNSVVLALITATVSVTIAALGSIAQVVIALSTNRKVDEVHKATNGLTAALVSVNREAAGEAGHAAGVEDEKQRSQVRAALFAEKRAPESAP